MRRDFLSREEKAALTARQQEAAKRRAAVSERVTAGLSESVGRKGNSADVAAGIMAQAGRHDLLLAELGISVDDLHPVSDEELAELEYDELFEDEDQE